MMWSGSFVPLITPFDRKGRLDQKTMERLVEWHIAEGTDGIVCSATTGEGPCLSDWDRKKNAEICIRSAAGRIPVVVSTGINDTRTSIRYTEQAKRLGASGCLVVTPYYNKPTQKGCILHFQEIAKVGLPVIVYHNPPRTAIKLMEETIIEISQLPSVVAIKESSHDLELVRKIAGLIPVFSGDDDLALPIMREGGVGSIATTSNVIPGGWKQMIQLCLDGKWDLAENLFQRYLPLCHSLFIETNPQGVKFALSRLKRCEAVLRLPMTLPSQSTQNAIEKELRLLALPHFEREILRKKNFF